MKARFDLTKAAGSFADPGAMLPLAVAMILFNGLSPGGLFFAVGLVGVLSALCYRAPVPLTPMKIVAAYAVATGASPDRVLAAGLILALVLLVVGVTATVDRMRAWIHAPVTGGLQLAAGLLLLGHGTRMIFGKTDLQTICKAVEPHLRMQSIGPVPIGIVLAVGTILLALALWHYRKLPAAAAVMGIGIVVGWALGTRDGLDKLSFGLYLPRWMPYGFPQAADLGFALAVLAIPQLPGVLEDATTAARGIDPESPRVTPRALCIGMGLANLVSFAAGGLPLAYGNGGAGAPWLARRSIAFRLACGAALAALGLLLGFHILSLIHLLPLSLLGALLLLVGVHMALTAADSGAPGGLWVTAAVAAVALASNLAIGFLAGTVLAIWLSRRRKGNGLGA